MIINLFNALVLVPLACTFVAEKSGIMDKLKYWLFYRVFTKGTQYKQFRIKPFDCAMCLSFWVCLLVECIDKIEFNPTTALLPFAAAAVGSLISNI